jgi:50S ribosomal protein L16 3-hydroxylase
MTNTLLGGLSAEEFLAEYWQKKPLLVRQAVPGFTGVVTRDELFQLARDPDVESRYVTHDNHDWEVIRGPQKAADLRNKKRPWTVLVQGLNLFCPDGDALLHRFDFIPQARLDDLMVSYAVDGGGVGPHFDNYDVFLLQGIGQRRWLISDQDDRSLIEDAPLKILQDFRPVHDWVLNPATCSICPPNGPTTGSRSASAPPTPSASARPPIRSSPSSFWATCRTPSSSTASTPTPTCAARPLRRDRRRHGRSGRRIPQADHLEPRRRARFLGAYLTEPKAHIFFDSPDEPLEHEDFLDACAEGISLDASSLLLFTEGQFFLNGEPVHVEPCDQAILQGFADRRRLDSIAGLSEEGTALLYDWYCCGFAHVSDDLME